MTAPIPPIPTAALIIIGNEILSGRTQDVNIQWLADKMTHIGIKLEEVRVVPDIEEAIVEAVNALRNKVTYLFTTGGIGPTHDDITAESIGRAFGREVTLDKDAHRMLIDYYGVDTVLNEARLKMAKVPEGATLIPNPVSGAPGFKIDNVYVMAGVPRIMQAMLDDIISTLQKGPRILSNSVTCDLGESAVAEKLEAVQNKFTTVEIGSYPHYRSGALGLSLVLRSVHSEDLNKATEDVIELVRSLGCEPRAISIQSQAKS